ncbi:MAG TPA: GNAT family N-acetyltransferase [Clostridiales bacterium]|nr:GNAT family N-acetyltransferase [Clostridiales bacterium]
MTQIYLIRHAEAEGNLYRRVQGHYDGDITERGRKQIDKLAERFRDIHLDALYSSDLRRAVTTASAITRYHDLPLITTPRLREVAMGCWEDRPWGEVEYNQREQLVHFNCDPENWDVEGCETFADLVCRIRGIILELAERHRGQVIALVSHGMTIRAFLASVMGISSREINKIPHSDNTAVSLINVDGEDIEIVFFNDNSHLPIELSTFAKQTWWKEKDGIDRFNLRFEPMNPIEEKELYINCYADSWKAVYGCLKGFDADTYWKNVVRHYKKNPLCLMKAMTGDELAGLVELHMERGKEQGAGWISLCYMVPEYRGRRLGIQLIGHAVSTFRSLGRSSLRLHVSEANKRAIGFYRSYGFKKIGTDQGVFGRLILMEKEI